MDSDTTDPLPPGSPGSSRTRWRVMLVRVPWYNKRRFQAALPNRRRVSQDDLPLILRITHSRQEATSTADRLRDLGGVVLILEEPDSTDGGAFCPVHPMRIAARTCGNCSTPICSKCTMNAEGEHLCPTCHAQGATVKQRIRMRQLFSIFLFFVFLYLVVDHIHDDMSRVNPTGSVRIAVLQFAPPEAVGAPIVRSLNLDLKDAATATTLRNIEPWFNEERIRYGGRDFLHIDVRGPWGVNLEPPELAGPGEWAPFQALAAWRYARYWNELTDDLGVDLDGYAARVYVIYGNEGLDLDLAAHSRGSEKGRLAIAFVSLSERNPAYPVVTVAHEIAHTLGAEDTYEASTSLAQHPQGFIEPFANPLYPQRYGELMTGGDIPMDTELEQEALSLERVRVGHHTAAGLRWIGPEQASLFYTPPAIGPEDKLTP